MDDLEWSQIFYSENVDKFQSGEYSWDVIECLLKTPTRFEGCHCHGIRWCSLCNAKNSSLFTGMHYSYDKAFFQTIAEVNRHIFGGYITGLGQMCSVPSVIADVMLDMERSKLIQFDSKVRLILLDISRMAEYYYANFGTPFNFDMRDDVWSVVYGRPWTAKWQNMGCKARFLVKKIMKKSRVFREGYGDDKFVEYGQRIEPQEFIDTSNPFAIRRQNEFELRGYERASQSAPDSILDLVKLLRQIQMTKDIGDRVGRGPSVRVVDTRVVDVRKSCRKKNKRKNKKKKDE